VAKDDAQKGWSVVFERIFEHVSAPLCLVDADGLILRTNAAWASILGHDAEALSGRPLVDLAHAAYREALGDAVRAVVPGAPPVRAVICFDHAEAGVRQLECTASQALSDGPIVIETRDVTERRREAIRAGEIEKITRVGTWEIELSTMALSWSPAVYEIYGHDPASFTPTVETALAPYPPEARAKLEPALAALIERAEPFDLELPFNRRSAGRRWIRATADVECIGGQPFLAFGTFQEVTDGRRRRDRMSRLGMVVERTASSVMMTDASRRIEFVNPAFTALTGYSAEEAIGRNPSAFLQCAETCPDTTAEIRHALDAGEAIDVEIRNPTKAGDLRWFSMEIQPLKEDDGEITGFVALQSDVTERRLAEMRGCEVMRLGRSLEKSVNETYVINRDTLRIVDANEAARNNLGYELDALRELSVFDIMPDLSFGDLEEQAGPLRTGTASAQRFFAVNRRRDGTTYPVEIGLQAIDGEPPLLVATALDIGAQRAAEAAREKAERDARRAREQLITAVEALPDGFVLYDADDRLVLCNQRYLEIYPESAPAIVPGATFEEILRYGLARGQYPPAVGREEEWLAERLSAHRAANNAVEQKISGGRWLRIFEQATPDGGRVGLRIDITEQVAARERAVRAEQRLRDAINALPIGFWLLDADDRLVMLNDCYRQMYALSAPALVEGATYEEILRYGLAHGQYPDALGREDDWLEEFLDHRRHDGYETVVTLAGNRRIRSFNTRTSDGGSVGFRVDVSEQVEKQEALELANAKLQAALSERDAAEKRFFDIAAVSADWFWEQDADGRFTYISKSFDRQTGGSGAVHIGRTRAELRAGNPALEGSADWAWLDERVARREPFSDFVYRAFGLGGEEIWVRISGSPFYDAHGAFSGYRGVGSDVSQLFRAKQRAEEANRAKSQFLANMSHEIRTPLNGVLGMAEVLAATVTDEHHRRLVATIRDSGELLLNLLNDILDLSKIEAGKLTLEEGSFLPSELAKKVDSLHRHRAAEKGLHFDVVCGDGTERHRTGDPHRVLQILHNLVSNAIKFTETGAVRIRLDAGPGEPVSIEVSDSGIGMSDAQIERLFDEFVQADSSMTRRFGGTGLGMAIVKRLVDAMGGTIDIDSTLGSGTTLTVLLPLDEAEAPRTSVSDEAEPVLPPALRILAADDNRTNRSVLHAMLTRLGALCTVVGSGREALEAHAKREFDVILLDIGMPEMDGVETLRTLHRHDAETGRTSPPCLAVTANALAHQISHYRRVGFSGHIAKPIRQASLLRGIAAALPSAQGPEPAGELSSVAER